MDRKKAPPKPLVQSSAFIGSNAAWLVTSRGTLLHTSDAGKSWKNSVKDSMGTIKHVSFVEEKRGWIVNDAGEVWSSTDGGDRWERVSRLESGERCDGLKFVDETHGWAIEPFSVWKTEDGGQSWKRGFPLENLNGIKEPFHGIDFVSLKIGWLRGELGAVYHTLDGGDTWIAQKATAKKADISAMFFLNERIGWLALRPGGTVLRTDSAGQTWHELKMPISGLRLWSIHFVNSRRGWVTGSANTGTKPEHASGVLLHTNDGGESWQLRDLGEKEAFYNAVHFTDEEHGWLLGQKSVYYTSNGGDSWNAVLRR